MLPSKSGSKYSLKNIMTENIWKIFAPWRGPHLKLLFSTFFQVTVYLVDTQNFRVRWRPLHVFFQISLQILVIFDRKNIWNNLLGVVYHVKKVSTIFDENWSHNINLKKKMFHFLKSDMKTHSAMMMKDNEINDSAQYFPEWNQLKFWSHSNLKSCPSASALCWSDIEHLLLDYDIIANATVKFNLKIFGGKRNLE